MERLKSEMMTDTEIDLRASLEDTTPQELISELKAMRRNPASFHFKRRSTCPFGCDSKGGKSAYQIGHADCEEAGTWCPTHGWLSFSSSACPPTERLSASEVADRRKTTKPKTFAAGGMA